MPVIRFPVRATLEQIVQIQKRGYPIKEQNSHSLAVQIPNNRFDLWVFPLLTGEKPRRNFSEIPLHRGTPLRIYSHVADALFNRLVSQILAPLQRKLPLIKWKHESNSIEIRGITRNFIRAIQTIVYFLDYHGRVSKVQSPFPYHPHARIIKLRYADIVEHTGAKLARQCVEEFIRESPHQCQRVGEDVRVRIAEHRWDLRDHFDLTGSILKTRIYSQISPIFPPIGLVQKTPSHRETITKNLLKHNFTYVSFRLLRAPEERVTTHFSPRVIPIINPLSRLRSVFSESQTAFLHAYTRTHGIQRAFTLGYHADKAIITWATRESILSALKPVIQIIANPRECITRQSSDQLGQFYRIGPHCLIVESVKDITLCSLKLG